LIANMRPLRSGRAFQRFWKALAWVATSLISGQGGQGGQGGKLGVVLCKP
jgi:hypothetical protein